MSTEVNLINTNIAVNSINSTGIVIAGAFFGDGSQLTNVTVLPVSTQTAVAYLNADNTINDSLIFAQKNVFPSTTTGLAINNGGFTCSSSGIVIPEDGVYIVGFSARFTTTIQRAAIAADFTINSTKAGIESVASYIRNASPHENSSTPLTAVFDLVSGDELGICFAQYAQTGTVSLVSSASEASHYFVYRIS